MAEFFQLSQTREKPVNPEPLTLGDISQLTPRLQSAESTVAPGAASSTPPLDKHPFYNAIGRHRAGRTQAQWDAINLTTATNQDFVERINEDCHVGPHLEWLPAVAAAGGKAVAKAYVAGKLGEHGGATGKALGTGLGLGWGVIGGLYVGYESAELLENSCKAKAFENRLQQNSSGQTPFGSPPGADQIPLPNMPYGVEHQIPGVRDVVDQATDWTARNYYHLRNKERPEPNSDVFDTVLKKNQMTNSEFLDWAKKETSYSRAGALAHHAAFMGPAYLGAAYTAHKLALQRGALPLKAAGLAIGFGLSYLGMRAQEETGLSELYSARLLSRPEDRP